MASYLEGLRLWGIDFYVGFDTAAGYDGWYPEAYGRVTIGVQSSDRHALASVKDTFVRVVRSPPAVFAGGVITDTRRGVRLPIATREQTILDVV